MKRILILLLVLCLSMSVLVGCEAAGNAKDVLDSGVNAVTGFFGSAVDTVKGWFGLGGSEGEGEGEGEPVVDELLQDASKYLNDLYKENTEINRDFDVVAQVLIDGIKYPVTWDCDNKDKVSIINSVRPNFYTIDIPNYNQEEFTLTLTATITNTETGNTDQRTYKWTVPVLVGAVTELEENVAYKLSFDQINLLQRFYALGKSYKDQNINATDDPTLAADYYVEAVEGGYKVYTTVDGVKNYLSATISHNSDNTKTYYNLGLTTEVETAAVITYGADMGAWYTTATDGDKVIKCGIGSYQTNDTLRISDWGQYFTESAMGVSQFPLQFIPSELAETFEPDPKPTIDGLPEAGATLSILDAIKYGEAAVTYTEGKYYVSGTISNITDSSYGNMYIRDENGNDLLIYGTYNADGSKRFDKMDNQPKIGDTITVYGIIGNYNSTAQMKNGWIVTINGVDQGSGSTGGGSTGGTTDDVTTATQLSEGIAYQLSLYQGTYGKRYYALNTTQEGANKYILTTTDASTAAEFYVEAVSGGYKVYTEIDGVKNYVYAKLEGTSKYIGFSTENASVLAYDSELGVWNVTINGAQYGIGTYGDFETISISEWKYYTADSVGSSQYVLGFIATEEVEEVDPNTCTHNWLEANCTTPKTCSVCHTTEGSALDHSYGEDHLCTRCGKADPDYYFPMTITEILAAADNTNVEVTGIVKEINTAYSSEHGNITVTIVDDNGKELYLFRLSGGETLAVHDKITVKGTKTTFNSAPQIGAGATYTFIESTTCSIYGGADCINAPSCIVCGTAQPDGVALGHTEANAEGKCDRCGLDLSKSYKIETISFATTDQRTSLTTANQTWVSGGLTFANDQDASTSSVADFSNPVRLYKSSKVTISAKGIAKIVINVNTGKPIADVQTSLTNAGATFTTEGQVITITFDTPVDSFAFSCAAQIRFDSIEVTHTV